MQTRILVARQDTIMLDVNVRIANLKKKKPTGIDISEIVRCVFIASPEESLMHFFRYEIR